MVVAASTRASGGRFGVSPLGAVSFWIAGLDGAHKSEVHDLEGPMADIDSSEPMVLPVHSL